MRARADLFLALGLSAAVQVETWFVQPEIVGVQRVIVAVLALAGTLSLVVRRSAPLLPAAAVTLELVVQTAVTGGDFASSGWLVTTMLVLYSVAAYSPPRRSALGFLLLFTGLMVRELRDLDADFANPWNFAFWTLLVYAWFGLGLYVRSRRRAQSVRFAAEQVELAAVTTTRQAVVEERARIAQELHDVVAQDVSAVVVQAVAADALLDTQPELARESIHKIQQMGREALQEMRQVLGILNADLGDQSAQRAPQPTLDQISDLVARQCALGLPATLEVVGVPRPLPPGLEVSAYRVAQEALTNVRKHAPTSEAVVTITFRDSTLVVDIVNALGAPASQQGGHGLIGMRERLHFFGGELRFGPESGKYVVHATFPIPAPA